MSRAPSSSFALISEAGSLVLICILSLKYILFKTSSADPLVPAPFYQKEFLQAFF